MSNLTIRTGGTAHPEDSVLQSITDLIVSQGVKDLSTTAHLKVVQRGAGANMSVDAGIGRGFILESPGNAYPIRSTTADNIVVTANSSGNPRIDAVVAYIDLSASPDATVTNVYKRVVVAGTPAASPVIPDDTAIGTAIGASNPYMILASVSVANGASSITNAEITDMRTVFKTTNSGASVADSDGATITMDRSLGLIHRVTLGGNRTIAFTGFDIDQAMNIVLKQDGTGSRTVTWPSGIIWFPSGAPVLTTTINQYDSFLIVKKSATAYEGYIIGQAGA